MNRLARETSPYLLQHATNPVDWHPWSDEAFDLARRRDCPIFLSVGYSSCHWCHVMAHESFEDEKIARILNDKFVPVKVDREERPDVDALYMEAVQAMTGRGGWPMSVFLTPDGRPFFGGTYFPPCDRGGMPGFDRVMQAVSDAWRSRRDEVDAQAGELVDHVRQRMSADRRAPQGAIHDPLRLLASAIGALERRFDAELGGFGSAPKFPQPALVELCLRHHRLSGDMRSLEMARTTLAAMAAGGIYDHVGGGFSRYSTDREWTVPHFEKMLYDQAGLVRAYLHLWQLTGEETWMQVVNETVTYVLRDLASSEGGLFSAEDADSEGEEGRFYLWDAKEISEAVGSDLAEETLSWYGVMPQGNFEGRSILRRPLGATLHRPGHLEQARAALLDYRAKRVRPALDDKVLTEWNAMFCSSLAEAAAAANRSDWAERAQRIGDFILTRMRRPDGRLLRSYKDGQARHLAYAADYAWSVDCFVRLHELTGSRRWLEEASILARDMLRLFAGNGGLLRTAGADAERLVVVPVDYYDGAISSANSVACTALLRLCALVADDELTRAGETLLASLEPLASDEPIAMAGTVSASLLSGHGPSRGGPPSGGPSRGGPSRSGLSGGGVIEVVVPGRREDLLQALWRRFEPSAVVTWGEPAASPLWEGRQQGFAYVCRAHTCKQPASNPDELCQRLDAELAEERQAFFAQQGSHESDAERRS